MEPMPNIMLLLKDLQMNQWHITAFRFTYKRKQYIVLFEDISNLKLVAGEYVAYLTFIDRTDASRMLKTKANAFKFSAGAKEFREYFGIQYAPNLGDIFQQFYAAFNKFVPPVQAQNFDEEMKQAMVTKLCRNDNENINKLCCYAVKRNIKKNGTQFHRTPFNSDKTKLLRENLFRMFEREDTVSFCYREENPLDDEEICANFAKNENATTVFKS